MQLPDLLNRNNLFRSLNGLEYEEKEKLNQVKDEIFSRGTSALLHLIRIQKLNKQCVQEYSLYKNQLTNIRDSRIVFSSETLGYLLNEISPLFGTLRLLQNNSLKLLRTLGVNTLPKSLNDYIKKPDSHKVKPEIHQSILQHWNSSGEKLKHYRDVDQHYKWLTGRYFLQVVDPNKIIIEIPDNPETKSPKDFTYENQINAIDFLNKSFIEIHGVIENIAVQYEAKSKIHQQGLLMDQLGDLTPYTNRTLSFMYSNQIKLENGVTNINIEGLGIDQLETGQLSLRKYFFDKENLDRAKKIYGQG